MAKKLSIKKAKKAPKTKSPVAKKVMPKKTPVRQLAKKKADKAKGRKMGKAKPIRMEVAEASAK